MNNSDLYSLAASLVAQNRYVEALGIYERLAEDGDVRCDLYVAKLLFDGIGVPQDRLDAMCRFRRVAETGVPDGMFYFASALSVQGEDQEAFKWYQRAAAKYYSPALFRLGNCYLEGIGIEKNKKLGFSCLEEAARSGHVIAMGQLARRYLRGENGIMMLPRGIKLLILAALKAWRHARRDDPFAEDLMI